MLSHSVTVSMKYSAAILLALVSLSAASFLNRKDDVSTGSEELFKSHNTHHRFDDISIDDRRTHGKVDDLLVRKQKIVLQLLTNLQQDKIIHENLMHLANEFDLTRKLNNFHNIEAIKKFIKNYENNNFLPKDEVFIATNQQHQNQAAQLFTFLYSAQDWETLMEAAAWARTRFNTEQFAYTFAAVVLNHPITRGVVIPPLYEIIPHAFVPATTMKKIYKARLEGIKKITVRALYNNQNRNNINYNRMTENLDELDTIDRRTLHNDKKYTSERWLWGPNSIFADNDGSLDNTAGITENPETKLSYFTEDIGINDLHARFYLLNPVFLGVNMNKNFYTRNLEKLNLDSTVDTNKLDIERGEAFYFAHQQLYARYVLERLSNNLPIPHPINMDHMIETGYNPNLEYINGQAVPARPPRTMFWQQRVEEINDNNNLLMPNNFQSQKPKIYEQRLQQVAESGLVLNQDGTKTKLTKHNGLGILANLIAAPASSLNPDFYGDYFSTAKNAIGNIVDPNYQNGVAAGVVANYATAARDPAYYQLLAKLTQIFNNLQNKQGPYAKSELIMNGVKIEKVDCSKLETFLDTFTINVNNAIPKMWRKTEMSMNTMTDLGDEDYNVKFQRLTNKPFDIKMQVLSDKVRNAIVRVFIGPKYDSNGQRFTLAQASQYFVQLDQFKIRLHSGTNMIERNSHESNVNVYNPTSIKKLWTLIEQGQTPYMSQADYQVLGLLRRAQLPKGKTSGQQFVMYIIINDINEMLDDTMNTSNEYSSMELNKGDYNMEGDRRSMNFNEYLLKKVRDHRSVGYPLDRPIVDVNYNTANQYFKTVTIYHKLNNNI